ncbi:MAG: CHASE2 domain-containing protein [Bdellovibrionales bacterium]|nr:CHASE2 domain-containing protein [Bdellovibrionales bacterium]
MLKRSIFFPFKPWLINALRIAFAVSVAGVLCQIKLHYLEALTYDFRMAYKPVAETSGQVETIAIDAKTLKELQKDPDGDSHQKLIAELRKSKPRAVVYVFDPTSIKGELEEVQAFTDEAAKLDAFYYGANLLPKQGHESLLKLDPPFETIPVFPAPKTSDLNIFAKDGVTRRFIFSFDGFPTLHPLLARTYNGLQHEEDYNGLFEFIGTKQAYIHFRPTGTYKAHSFVDVMEGKVKTKQFHDKIVMVGKDTLETTKDYLRTPFSRNIVAMTNLEMHANILDTLILNQSPLLSPKWQDFLLTALISILTVFVVLTLRPTKGILILGATVSGFSLFCYLLFAVFDIWVEMTHPLLSIFICYYFFIPYRLIIENRRSWEYYQKNKLLTQVEELKSNFLRMMSHDLKTPLARIQGMADIVLRDKVRLNQDQQKAVYTIADSTEELSEFIGSILSLGRIESKEIKLNLKSKDVNDLLQKVIDKSQYLANRKNIDIITEFEPLFSVKADEDLLKQVFTNLVENAIKYSPDESKILVTTEEVDGKMVVQVADQGRGISEADLDNVFEKFYRTKDVVNSDVGGSGLGLFLAKYFVELHHGDIEVESQPGQGSTFTVSLPMDV